MMHNEAQVDDGQDMTEFHSLTISSRRTLIGH